MKDVAFQKSSVEPVAISKHVVADVPVTDIVNAIESVRGCAVEDEATKIITDKAANVKERTSCT